MHPLAPTSRTHRFALAATVILTVGLTASVAQARMDRPSSVPTVEAAQTRLVDATDQLSATQQEIAALEAEREAIAEQRRTLDQQQLQTFDLLQQAGREARAFLLDSYIGGGDLTNPDVLLAGDNAADVSWRWYLVADRAALAHRAIDRYEALRLTADQSIVDLAARGDEIASRLRQLAIDVERLEAQVANETQWVVIAQAWADSDAAVAQGRFGDAPQSAWDRLRFCESSDNYQAISPSGIYRGAYQFDRTTWRTVGGTGDPAAAPPLEQDARARILYARRGSTNTWPVCGRYLP